MMKLMNPIRHFNKIVLSIATSLALASVAQADCTYELFTISAVKGTSISEYVEQLSNECELSIIISDPIAEKKMDKKLQKTAFKNLTLNEVFDLLLIENNLNYTLENNILRISFLETKTYNIDYILTQRKSIGSTDVMLSSTSGSAENTSGATQGASADSTSETTSHNPTNSSGIKIQSTDEVSFWEELDLELQRVLNRPEDYYSAEAPIINKNAGLVTVTATVRQHKRLSSYLKELQKKVQYQVLIDVHMMAVVLNDSSATGIDWSQIYALQNFAITAAKTSMSNVNIFDQATGAILGGAAAGATGMGVDATAASEFSTIGRSGSSSLTQITGGGSINELVKFLNTQGDIEAISNPKVLTLNNQPALITVGTEYFYSLTSISNIQNVGGSTQAQDITINSVFAGVLLDITPEISHDQTITLKINPSLSATVVSISSEPEEQTQRRMPPDLDRRQLSSVVTVKDGNRIIIGGLIDSRERMSSNQVPLLGDIPGLGYLFKYEEKVKQLTELVIVIEPHIIKKENNTLSLADLGYTKYTNEKAGLAPGIEKKVAKEANE